MKPTLLTLLVCGLLPAAAPAAAQTRPTPGLWEYTSRMGGNPEMEAAMARMQAQLAAMPPEKRKQMEAMLAQQGVSMPGAAAGGGMVVKTCITAEQAARDEMALPPDSNCKLTSQSRSANTFKFAMACGAPREGTGEGEVTFVSPKEHKGRIKVTSARPGAPGAMDITYQAKWLAASCGDVKPR
jgi:hypothetical protein